MREIAGCGVGCAKGCLTTFVEVVKDFVGFGILGNLVAEVIGLPSDQLVTGIVTGTGFCLLRTQKAIDKGLKKLK